MIESGGPHGYLASSSWPARPGGGPTSTESNSTQAWASWLLACLGRPITSSAAAPCRRRISNMTSAFGRQRGAIGPSLRPRWMARPSFCGGTTGERPRDPPCSALTCSGRGRRDTKTTLTYDVQIVTRSLTLLRSGSRGRSDIVHAHHTSRALRGRLDLTIFPFSQAVRSSSLRRGDHSKWLPRPWETRGTITPMLPGLTASWPAQLHRA